MDVETQVCQVVRVFIEEVFEEEEMTEHLKASKGDEDSQGPG